MLPADLQSPQSRSPITYLKVLVVEGHDVFQFFKALLRHLNLLIEIEIRNFGGVDDLAEYLGTLRITSGFVDVTSLGIVRDAETDAAQAFQAVCGSLGQVNLGVPRQPMAVAEGRPKVSVFILPDCANPGSVETLCLQAVSSDPAVQCIEEYFQCLQRQGLAWPNNMAKAQVHAFLSSRSRPSLLLGQAAHEGYWPWDGPAFDQLKQFLWAM